jgi:phosphate transport system substrate-binding protein
VEDSETSGRIKVISVPEARPLVAAEVAAFRKAYPDAAIELATGTSREAVTALLGRQADLAVLTRELEPEERTVVVKGGMELEGYRFARDAICVIVNPSNPVLNLAADDLRRIYRGEVTNWRELGGGPGPVEPVVPDLASDLMISFVQRVLGGEDPTAPAYRSESDSATVRRVLERPGAIGFVSMPWADRGARALRLSALAGMAYWKVDPETVYKGEYPLTRYCNLYVRSGGPRLANGLVTYVSSLDGQKIVHEAGLVPTTVPVRFARRSPMLGAH